MTDDTAVRTDPALVPFGSDPMLLRSTFAQFPSGVVALSTVVEEDEVAEPVVLIASSFQVGISAEPPLVLVAVQHTSTSWPRLKAAAEAGRRLGVSVLGDRHELAARQLASKAGDRFAGIATVAVVSGAHFLQDAPVWLECSIHTEVPAGDHDVILLEVHASHVDPSVEPLVWHGSGFRGLRPAGAGPA